MAKITIDKERCKGCFLCISFCPKGLINKSKNLNARGVNYVEFSLQGNLTEGIVPPRPGKESIGCVGCAMCAIICPDCCIEVYK